ncbi:MAG: DNA-binding protein [Pedosphaera sp.]|nr:DNA-binding protein [Pedosphaera sp.]
MNSDFDPRFTPLPISYFEQKYELSRPTIWRYRRAGLPSIGVGDKIFIRESDFVAFLTKMDGKTVSAVSNKGAKG